MSAKTRPRQLQIVTPEEELENLRNEVGVLRRAVESKSAAVGILRGELQECQRERDKFRTLAEQGPLHHPILSPRPKVIACPEPSRSAMVSGSEDTLAQLLSRAKEENRSLRQDATQLRCRLHDAQADIKVLREEVERWRSGRGRGEGGHGALVAPPALAQQQREQFISQMEQLSVKCQALEGDVRGLVEEREELVRELDAASHKLHRLNHILTTVLSSAPSAPASPAHHMRRMIDLDAIITENRYLQQRVKQAEDEAALAKSNATKYKAALEKCRSQGSLKLGASDTLIVTPKQVSELLQEYHGEVGGAAEGDLKSLCVALVDALNQRSRALRTQRSANKVLVGRVSELERRLSTGGGSEASESPPLTPRAGQSGVGVGLHLASLALMDGYTPPSGPTRFKGDNILNDPRLAKLLGHSEEEKRGRDGTVERRGGGEGRGEKGRREEKTAENGRGEEGKGKNRKGREGKGENGCVVITNGEESDGVETMRNGNAGDGTGSDRCIRDGKVRARSNIPEESEEDEITKSRNMKNGSESNGTSKSTKVDNTGTGNTIKNDQHDNCTGNTAVIVNNKENEVTEPISAEYSRSNLNGSKANTHDATSHYNSITAGDSDLPSPPDNISYNTNIHESRPVSAGNHKDASETPRSHRVPPTTTNVSASVTSSKNGSNEEMSVVFQEALDVNGYIRQNVPREAASQRKSSGSKRDTTSLEQLHTASQESRHAVRDSTNPGDFQTAVNPSGELEEIVPIDQLDLYIREVRREASRARKKAEVERVEGEMKDSVEKKAGEVEEEQEDEEGEEVRQAGEGRDISEKKMERQTKTVGELENIISNDSTSESPSEHNSDSISGKHTYTKEPQKESQSHSINSDKKAGDEEGSENCYRNERNYESEDDISFNLDLSDYDSDDDKLDAALQAWQSDVGKAGNKSSSRSENGGSGGKEGFNLWKKRDGKNGKDGFSLWRKDGRDGMDRVDLPPALRELLDGTTGASMGAGTDCT